MILCHMMMTRNGTKSHRSPYFQLKCIGYYLWIYNPPQFYVRLHSMELRHDETNNEQGSIIQLIKLCGTRKDISRIRRICADKPWIANDAWIATTLIRSFAKCGALKEALDVFDQIANRGVVSWNALIAGYVEHGFGEEALRCFREMENNIVAPNVVTYTSILKACAIVGDFETVQNIHTRVQEERLLNNHIVLGTALLNAYAKCGAVKEAQDLFDHLVEHDVVSWSTLVAGYAEQGFSKEALAYFWKMESNGLTPDTVTYACFLKACGTEGALKTVKEIHARVREQKSGSKHIILGNSLVNAYAKCGAVKESRELFDQLMERDVVSWNVLIAGYTEHGYGEEALTCFKEMASDGVEPDSATYASILKACAIVGDIKIVQEIHVCAREKGLINKCIAIGNSLVNAYAKCGAVKEAQEVFDQLLERDVISWNTLIAGYAENGFGEEAISCFMEMGIDRVPPDSTTYACVLKACGIVGSIEIVKEIHSHVREKKLLNKHIALGTALVSAYTKCGAMKEAQRAFHQLPERNVVSWSALIAGYAEQGFGEEALTCFQEMKDDGVRPDLVAYACSLKAAGCVECLETVKEIHAHVVEQNLLSKHIVLGNSLVHAYAKCSVFKEARDLFDQLSEQNVVSWNALIAGYAEQGFGEAAITCFREMEETRVTPNSVTYTCILTACSTLGVFETVKEIHAQVREKGLLHNHIILVNALLNAYAKCGSVNEARKIFDQLAEQDGASWNAVVAGYAQLGWLNEMLHLFNRMTEECIFPDSITFVALLNCCSHGALLDDGKRLFYMIGTYGLTPTPEHYACMVDLFGRSGRLDDAKYFVLDHTSPLLAFLGACQKWGNVELGRWGFENVLQLNPTCSAAYVCMSNIYAAVV